MELVSCAELIGTSTFKSCYDVIFIGCLSKEMHRTGFILDISMMNYREDIISEQHLNFLDWLEYKGCLKTGIKRNDGWKPSGVEPYVFDVSVVSKYQQCLLEDTEECWQWSDSWSRGMNYGDWDKQMYSTNKVDNLLMHLVAIMIWDMMIKQVEDKPIKIIVDGVIAHSVDAYLGLYALKKTLPWFDRKVLLEVSGRDGGACTNNDPEFSLFIKSGIEGGRRRGFSVREKRGLLNKYGICEQSIVVLYERTGLRDSNYVGRVVPNVKLCRIDSITKDGVSITIFPLYKTKQEVYDDYYSIPDDKKYMFVDMLDFKVQSTTAFLEYYLFGVGNYLLDESKFFLPLDTSGKELCTKHFTIKGKSYNEQMTEANAIFYLLKEYGVDFNEKLFRRMSLQNEERIWWYLKESIERSYVSGTFLEDRIGRMAD